MTTKSARAWMVARLAAPTEAMAIQDVEIPEPGANQVRIEVDAFCLDFNDIDTIRGRYGLLKFDPPFVVGMACAGTVEAAGAGCEALIGKRVVGVSSGAKGAYASAAVLDAPGLQLVPSWLGTDEAIAMYFPYLLSDLALRVRGRLRAGEVVLIHARRWSGLGCSATGQVAGGDGDRHRGHR